MRRALAIDETSFGPEHPNVARDLNSLARLLRATNRLTEAEPLMRRALAIDEKSFGPEHPNVAVSLNSLARLLQDTNRLAEAERLMRRALAIDERSFGADHPNLIIRLNSLARLLQETNRQAEAEPLLRRALAIGERAFVWNHPTLGVLHDSLGGLYKALGRRGEALPLLKKALAINETALGSEHPRLAYTLTQLGDLYRLDGQCARAEPLFLRARAIGAASIREVPVLFGTNRKRDVKQPSVAFGGERERSLSAGLVIVTVPTDQVSGPSEGPKTDRVAVETTLAGRLAMHCIEVVDDKRLVEAAVARIGAAKRYPNQALVFVHGYNVSFEDALRRAAQIAYDIEFDGGVFVFSWPARGGWRAYLDDRNTVDLAKAHFREFVDRVVAETKAGKVHFVAHSMGNMVLLDALERIAAAGPRYAIGEIVSAAPDVDRDLFESLTRSIKAKGGSFTLYSSRGDWALWLSEKLWGEARAGFIGKDTPLIAPGVDTIDITAAGTKWFDWNHDLYASSPILVADMRRLFQSGKRPPDSRTKEFERVEAKAGTYWRLRQP
jgi:esterase/lipase superfamily enzyme